MGQSRKEPETSRGSQGSTFSMSVRKPKKRSLVYREIGGKKDLLIKRKKKITEFRGNGLCQYLGFFG